MFSFGFQQAFRRGLQPGDRDFLEKVSKVLPAFICLTRVF